MSRLYVLAAICAAIVLASGSVLMATISAIVPSHSGGADGGPPPTSGVLARTGQEREILGDREDVIRGRADTLDFRLRTFLDRFDHTERQLEMTFDQMQSALRMNQAPLRTAAEQFNTAVRQLDAYNAGYEAQRRYAAQMAGQVGAIGGDASQLVPTWDSGPLAAAWAARDQFDVARTAFVDSVEHARLDANMSLARTQQEIATMLNEFGALHVEELGNRAEMLELYERIIAFVNRFGRLSETAVDLPPSIRPGAFSGSAWRELIGILSRRVESGMTTDAVVADATRNIEQDERIQLALKNARRTLE